MYFGLALLWLLTSFSLFQAVGYETHSNTFFNSIGFLHLQMRPWLCHTDMQITKEETEY